jgi:hypothetical protein
MNDVTRVGARPAEEASGALHSCTCTPLAQAKEGSSLASLPVYTDLDGQPCAGGDASGKHTFRTGDIVRAVVPVHLTNKGVHVGRMAARANGAFTIATRHGTVTDNGYRYCTRLQRNDGYGYVTPSIKELVVSQASKNRA